jgi:hypothetical protein
MKKQLLNEQEIRKFMKFANIGALTENFIDRVNEEEVDVEADDEVAGDEIAGDEVAGAEIAGDEIAGDEIAGDEIAGDEIAGDDAGELGIEKSQAEEILTAVVDKLADVLGIEAEVENSPDGADRDELPALDDMSMPPEEEEGPASEMGAPEIEDDEEPDMDALMQEVTRRVAARLLKENKR